MELTAHEDIEAPLSFVFQQVSDFSSFERQAMRRGADVRRRDSLPRPGKGSGWDIIFKFWGKDRQVSAEVTDFDVPNQVRLNTVSGGIAGVTVIELVPLARTRTRLTTRTELVATGLSARLLLQSLKQAKGALSRRLSARIATFATDVEGRYARKV